MGENFAGTVICVSHDRWFLDRIATHSCTTFQAAGASTSRTGKKELASMVRRRRPTSPCQNLREDTSVLRIVECRRQACAFLCQSMLASPPAGTDFANQLSAASFVGRQASCGTE